MFDYYYSSDNKLLKRVQWYSILTGVYWVALPIGSILVSLYPGILKLRPFQRFKSTEVLYDDFDTKSVFRIRVEVVLGIIYWVTLWKLLNLQWQSVIVLYACVAFNWSTRQYVTHAFTPRHVIEGALNLRVSTPMRWILLNGHWDQVHHKYPHVPWFELPKHSSETMSPVSYWRQYFQMWQGPRPNFERAPLPMHSNIE